MNIVRVFLVKQSPLVTCSAGQRYSLFTYPITQYVLSDSGHNAAAEEFV